MATRDDLRRIALSLPETATDNDGFSYGVAGKAIVWTWLERIHPEIHVGMLEDARPNRLAAPGPEGPAVRARPARRLTCPTLR